MYANIKKWHFDFAWVFVLDHKNSSVTDTHINELKVYNKCKVTIKFWQKRLCSLRELSKNPCNDEDSAETANKWFPPYGFPNEFIQVLGCLYLKSNVSVNVSGILTENFEVEKGVKQGFPLSAALYVCIYRLSGTCVGHRYRVAATAYADASVIMQNQVEMEILTSHLNLYEQTSGAKLNYDKTEGVWIGE